MDAELLEGTQLSQSLSLLLEDVLGLQQISTTRREAVLAHFAHCGSSKPKEDSSFRGALL